MYVIMRSDGAFVAPSGSRSSYVRELQYARQFHSRAMAERECCPENETVRAVSDFFRGWR